MDMLSSMDTPQEKPRVIFNPAPFYHIYGIITGIMSPLSRGIPSVIMGKFDILEFFRHIQTYRIDHVYAVPPMVFGLLGHPRRFFR